MRNILVKSANNKKRTLEILLPVCCTIDSVKFLMFKKMKGFSRKTLAISLKDLERTGFCTVKPLTKFHRVEYRLTTKGQESNIYF
jgi:DNA-binding HxlR family transcriptional regulator